MHAEQQTALDSIFLFCFISHFLRSGKRPFVGCRRCMHGRLHACMHAGPHACMQAEIRRGPPGAGSHLAADNTRSSSSKSRSNISSKSSSRKMAAVDSGAAASSSGSKQQQPASSGWDELFARVTSGLDEGPPAMLSRVHAAALAARGALHGFGGIAGQQQQDQLGSAAAAAAAAAAELKGGGYDLSDSLLPAAAPAVSFGLRDGLAASLARYTRECRRLRSQGLLTDGLCWADVPAAAAAAAAAGSSSEASDAAAAGQQLQQQERLVGLEGSSSGVDVAAFRGLRLLYQQVALEARKAAEASQQQLLAAVDMERDLKGWAAAKAAIMQQLSLLPAAADTLALAGDSQEGGGGPQLQEQPHACLSPHPLLTQPEHELLFALPGLRLLQQQQDGRGLALLLQQLPAAAAAAAASAAVESEKPSALVSRSVCLPASLLDSWGVWTPEQQQHCSNWLRLLLGILRCVEAWRGGPPRERRGPLLWLVVCNALAALEEDRRLAAGAPDLLLQASKAAAAARGMGEQLCCSIDSVLPWLQLAAAEETGGDPAEVTPGSLWWPAIYLAFRSGDILCLLCLGAGAFLPSACCSFAAAAAAAIAAAAADPSAAAQQQQGQEQEQQAACFKEFGAYPPMLPFVCRQLVVLLLQTSVGAVLRNAADKEGQLAADALKAFLAAFPEAAALAPEATTARAWSDCFVLYPPQQQHQQQQQDEEEQRRQQQDDEQQTDAHLLLLLSLLRPDLWPPLRLSETLQQVTQEDFLHYKLMLLLAQAQQQQQQQQQVEATLLRGLRALVSKVKLQGPQFFDPQREQQQLAAAAAAEGGLLQQQQLLHSGWMDPQQHFAAALHVNFTFAWLLSLCGGFIDALLWLLRSYPFLRRVAMLLLQLCYRLGCFESAALLHLSSDALHEAAQAADGLAAAAPAAAAAAAAAAGGASAGAAGVAAGAAAAGGLPWADEGWALEWQERRAPSEGPMAEFLAEDMAEVIGSTFGCTDTASVKLVNRLLFAEEPVTKGLDGELRHAARGKLKAVLLAAIDGGLAGSDPVTKVTVLSLLPLFWSVPLLPAVVREAYSLLTRPGVLVGDSDAAEGDLPPGLLEALLLASQPQQQLRPQQHRFLANFSSSSSSSEPYRLEDELWGSYFVLMDADPTTTTSSRKGSPWAEFDIDAVGMGSSSSSSSSESEELLLRRQQLEERPFFFLLYCALRQEARRRGDLKTAFAAAWLMTDLRSAADTLADALSSQLFSDFTSEASVQRKELRAFFLRASSVLQRSSARLPRSLKLLAARGLFVCLLSGERFYEAMHAFNSMQRELRLLPDAREEIAAYFDSPHDPRLLAGLLDALVFLLEQLLAQGYLLENLLPFERLLTFHLGSRMLLGETHLTSGLLAAAAAAAAAVAAAAVGGTSNPRHSARQQFGALEAAAAGEQRDRDKTAEEFGKSAAADEAGNRAEC
ncbi:hypothetical protein Efla_003770 [Eimeria flavescens]